MQRCSGILLHPSSLPGPYGIGTMGPEAYWFADQLHEMKQQRWQILPLYPTGYGDSPYQSLSAFAGNPLLISVELLIRDGYLTLKDIPRFPTLSSSKVDFECVKAHRNIVFSKAFNTFQREASIKEKQAYSRFCKKNHWLNDYALFMAIKDHHHLKAWNTWPKALRERDPEAINKYSLLLKKECEYHSFLQYLFFQQWNALKEYCHKQNVYIIGDNPIYEAYDSADVWTHPELFQLNKKLLPVRVAGVPPDCFSADGQRWGNPLYDWEKHKSEHYHWWIENLRASFEMTDYVRIDHFIGFVRYYSIPAKDRTARNGRWEQGPGLHFFETLQQTFGQMPIIAEDLGATTPEVYRIKEAMGFPGMKILQEAFDGNPSHPFLPHQYTKDFVVYTGTHDTNTTLASYRKLSPKNKKFLQAYTGQKGSAKDMVWELIRQALASVADTAIFPMQDILTLGEEARMNIPSTIGNNWEWRLQKKQLSKEIVHRMREMTTIYNR